jgi:ArsR family transcriptional regulator, arsenate/arsenite/antimonite-responsive transcriptional repressor
MLYRVFRALADPTRLRILNLLMEAPFCVCELGQALQLPQPLISRHLAYLKNAGLVQDHRQGMRVQYSISIDCQNRAGFDAFLRNALSSDFVCCEDLRRCRQIGDEPGRRSKGGVTSAVPGSH